MIDKKWYEVIHRNWYFIVKSLIKVILARLIYSMNINLNESNWEQRQLLKRNFFSINIKSDNSLDKILY